MSFQEAFPSALHSFCSAFGGVQDRGAGYGAEWRHRQWAGADGHHCAVASTVLTWAEVRRYKWAAIGVRLHSDGPMIPRYWKSNGASIRGGILTSYGGGLGIRGLPSSKLVLSTQICHLSFAWPDLTYRAEGQL